MGIPKLGGGRGSEIRRVRPKPARGGACMWRTIDRRTEGFLSSVSSCRFALTFFSLGYIILGLSLKLSFFNVVCYNLQTFSLFIPKAINSFLRDGRSFVACRRKHGLS